MNSPLTGSAARAATLSAGVMMLAGCFDAEVALDFHDPSEIGVRLEMSMARQLFDMMTDDDLCEGGEATLTEEIYTCEIAGSGDFDTIGSGGSLASAGLSLNPEEGMSLEALGDDRVQVTFDIATIFADHEPLGQEEGIQGMEDMIRAALAGHSFMFRVSATEIVSTTGILSDDGTEARRVVPIVLLLDEVPDFGDPFVTVVRWEGAT